MISQIFNRKALLKHVELFINGRSRNAWLEGDGYSIYVRKTKHHINERTLDTIDLANINFAPQYMGRGNFTVLLDFLEKQQPLPIYIENVLTVRFANFFRKRRYIEVNHTKEKYPTSFISRDS